jgi:hypothetical protein
MTDQGQAVGPPSVEVPVIEGELVTAVGQLVESGVVTKAIARALGVARTMPCGGTFGPKCRPACRSRLRHGG